MNEKCGSLKGKQLAMCRHESATRIVTKAHKQYANKLVDVANNIHMYSFEQLDAMRHVINKELADRGYKY